MNQVSLSQNINLSEPELFLHQYYKSCPLHPKRQLICLSTDLTSKYFLKCIECISDQSNQNIISLQTLMESEEKTIFKNWPIANDLNLYSQLLDISTRKSFVEETQLKISAYFKQFRSQIEEVLSEKENQMRKQTESLWDINEQVIKQYNQLAGKDELKDIIYNKKGDFEQQNKILGETIRRINHNQERNKQSLLDQINHLKNQENIFEIVTPIKIKDNIIDQIKQIKMFALENLEDIQIYSNQQNDLITNGNELQNNNNLREMKTSQLILNLIKNKFNNCSDSLIEQLQIIIKSISLYLDKKDVTNFINEDIFKYQQLNQQQQQNIFKLIDQISSFSVLQGDNYRLTKSPIQSLQPYSYKASQCLKSSLMDNFNSQLLVDYPILELYNKTKPIIKEIKIKQPFINASVNNSKCFSIEDNQNGNIIAKQILNESGKFMTEKRLDQDANYIFRCKINKMLSENGYSGYGIMQTSLIQKQSLSSDRCCFFSDEVGYGLDKILKGNSLSKVSNVINQVEIRVNLKKQILIFADYPNYNNINSTDPDKIKLGTDYSFGINLDKYSDKQNEIEIQTFIYQDDETFTTFN